MPPRHMVDNTVSLRVNGWRYEGWESVTVTRNIENAAATFSLTLSERLRGEVKPRRIRPGDRCRVTIGPDLVLTGQVDDVSVDYSARHHTLTVAGRSRTAQLVDCSASEAPGAHFGVKLEEIGAKLAAPYGVEVVAAVDTGPSIDKVQIFPGETVHAVLERHARPLGLLLTDDAQGRLVLTRAGAERNAGGLALGTNILSAHADFSQRERYTHYVVKGQRQGARGGTARDFAGSVGTAADPQVPDGRRILIVSETQGNSAAMATRAAWEAATRAGRSLQAQITTAGWRDAKGALWRTNALTRVTDAWLGIERDLLVTAATFSLSDSGGSTVAMTLAPPEAFTPQAEVGLALGKGIRATRERDA